MALVVSQDAETVSLGISSRGW